MNLVTSTVAAGLGATAAMDLWALARRRLLGVPLPNYAHVGRWVGHMRHGRFRHAAIARAAPLRNEAAIGWTVHYLIGVAFAALVPATSGPAWFAHPTPGPALAIGLATVAAPLLLMQPGMGAGLAARRTPHPQAARLHSLINHAVFGVGLYATALCLQLTGAN